MPVLPGYVVRVSLFKDEKRKCFITAVIEVSGGKKSCEENYRSVIKFFDSHSKDNRNREIRKNIQIEEFLYLCMIFDALIIVCMSYNFDL